MSELIKKRAIIFVHYDKDGLLDPHVQFFLRELRGHCAMLIFVSTSISPDELKKAAIICDKAISRENVGYDFVSWKVGLHNLEDSLHYDEITFVNDSCYGPVFSFDQVFRRAATERCDIWGLTYSYQHAPHLQSFFFSFRKSVTNNPDFFLFWDSVTPQPDKQEIIRRYEVGMTQFFQQRGYKIYSLFDTKKLFFLERFLAVFFNGSYLQRRFIRVFKGFIRAKRPRNPMHVYWRTVLNSGIPLIKVELLRDNPIEVNLDLIRRYLKRRNSYDSELISRHLDRVRL